MSLFDSDWQRLHKKVSKDYELIVIRYFETGLSPERADVFGIIAVIIREYLPSLSDTEVKEFVRNEYNEFMNFSVQHYIADALKKVNPDIPEIGIYEIYENVRNRFHDSERRHEYFLFFIISKIIELNNLSISRGYYLLEISTGKIPKPSRFIRFFQMWRHVARYLRARNQTNFKPEHEDLKHTHHKKFNTSTNQIIRIQFGDKKNSEINSLLTEVIETEFGNKYDLRIETSPDYQELFEIANSGKSDIFIINLTRIHFDGFDFERNKIQWILKFIENLKVFGWQSLILLSGYSFEKRDIDIFKDKVDYYLELPFDLEEFKTAFDKCLKNVLEFRD